MSLGLTCTHCYIKIFLDNQQDLLYSTWNFASCYVAAWIVGVFVGEMNTYICKAKSFLWSPKIIATLLTIYTPI